ncbi:hypothetical protein BKA56DRAFT_716999 [Ilyonectria sp. MPI-CAGE-AT-0026]|nr:hypothetical protein BKA56DRAFT_716999 [Ilyonectria sp. MPI-CAGE-AT-0026]
MASSLIIQPYATPGANTPTGGRLNWHGRGKDASRAEACARCLGSSSFWVTLFALLKAETRIDQSRTFSDVSRFEASVENGSRPGARRPFNKTSPYCPPIAMRGTLTLHPQLRSQEPSAVVAAVPQRPSDPDAPVSEILELLHHLSPESPPPASHKRVARRLLSRIGRNGGPAKPPLQGATGSCRELQGVYRALQGVAGSPEPVQPVSAGGPANPLR